VIVLSAGRIDEARSLTASPAAAAAAAECL